MRRLSLSLPVAVGIAALATAGILLACLCVGPGETGRGIALGFPDAIILHYRLYPLLAAALVGAGLAGAGVVLQSLVKNPLADPFLLGLSSGAGLGAVVFLAVASTLGASVIGQLGLAGCAAVGALITGIVVFALAQRRGGLGFEPITLVLVGVVINAINAALLELLSVLVLPHLQERVDLTSYLMGQIDDGVGKPQLIIAAMLVAIGWVMAAAAAGAMNAASFSADETVSLGVRLGWLRRWSFVAASLLAAAAILLAGPIAFVGLIAPHICRRWFGPDHRMLLATTPFIGACFLAVAFAFVHATGAWFNGDLPIGVITALCGGPLFLVMLRKRAGWGDA